MHRRSLLSIHPRECMGEDSNSVTPAEHVYLHAQMYPLYSENQIDIEH